MHALVPVIIIAIICIQVFFFVKNLLRMGQFSKIFSEESSWRLRRNEQTNLVDGVYGAGNTIFESIKNSINKYLGNNSGSVIDFGLLKDAVDRHCDSVENDIATQTPIPLFHARKEFLPFSSFSLQRLNSSEFAVVSKIPIMEASIAHATPLSNALMPNAAFSEATFITPPELPISVRIASDFNKSVRPMSRRILPTSVTL